ncbi:cytosine/adenosine deaminase-related metal-dependent hydrolase [Chitinophaga dinghuensis]|uniref:Cytosine/adenosine deaminase-related metal-dependent hydrolase n=1 Tax=Chitinophaga dinghuensis TaxID=1539050 RepID=A0A327VQ60_9BACT|nr:amidohydrolase family protein [Chitinophaga dinghuensis]RAJ75497.1 cytosine/adenosine deaminase-related metal-dependent hydrolase [Chitinophaga dinghuensis]
MKQIKLKGKDIFDGYHFLGPNKVLILDETGTVTGITDYSSDEDIQEIDGILCPGFVNAHCHLELSHMKNVIPEGTGLPGFLTRVMQLRQQNADQQETAMNDAAQAMWEAGISVVGDISNNTASISRKKNDPIRYHTFVECMGVADNGADSRYQFSMDVLGQFRELDGARHSSSIVPHAPYSVSRTLFGKIAATPANTPVSIHNQETAAENQLYNDKTGDFLEFYKTFGMDISGFQPTGTNSLEAWLPDFSGQKMILVHNTFSTETDIRFAQQQASEIWWCLCPQANLYIENRLPDIPLLRRMNCNIVVGTDSLASNHQLSIWAEIQTIRQQYPAIPLEELLQWATSNGARALGLEGYGSFQPGSRPGVVVINQEAKRII